MCSGLSSVKKSEERNGEHSYILVKLDFFSFLHPVGCL